MKPRHSLILAACLLLSGCWSGCQTPAPSPAPTDSPITHFRWIDQAWGICASGQPDAKGFAWLSVQPAGQKGQGIGRVDHIIKLNSEEEGGDLVATSTYGFSLEYDPIGLNLQTNPLAHDTLDKYIRETLKLMRPGTLVHCTLGDDRTGAFIYAYRRNCGWSDAAARLELGTNNFHEALFGLKYFVDHYQPDLSSTNTPKAWKARR